MANPVRQARMPPELDERLTSWAGERGIRESEAMRRLLERGLDAERDDGQGSRLETLKWWTGAAGLVTVPLGVIDPALFVIGGLYAAVGIGLMAHERRSA